MERFKQERRWSFDGFREGLIEFTAEDYRNSEAPAEYLIAYTEGNEALCIQLFSLLLDDAMQKRPEENAGYEAAVMVQAIRAFHKAGIAFNTLDSVRQFIWAVIEDEGTADKVAVLPLPCGTGKSTALRGVIRDVIQMNLNGESTDGMIAVTDKDDRLAALVASDMDPNSEESQFFVQHNDMFTLVLSENKAEAMREQWNTPVLLMTTQRYFHLIPDDLLPLLEWKNGKRKFIIIDEEPPLQKVVRVNTTVINHIASALKDGISNLSDQADKRWCLAQWDSVREKIRVVFSEYERLLPNRNNFHLYHVFPQKQMTDDDERFLRFIVDNRKALQGFDYNILFDIRAVYQLFIHGALFHTEKYGQNYENSFYLVVDDRGLVTDIPAKVVILDGTGKIAPVYDQDYIVIANCDDYQRLMDNVTIQITNTTTSKRKLTREYSPILADIIKRYVDSQPPIDKRCVFFPPKNRENDYRSEDSESNTAHLGDIKGRNDFRNDYKFGQVGLFRFPPSHYLALSLSRQPAFVSHLTSLSHEKCVEVLDKFIEVTNGNAEIMIPMLAADVIQNLYRGHIRYPESVDPYKYFMFCNAEDFAGLIKLLEKEYKPLGATIESRDFPDEFGDELKLIKALQKDDDTKAKRFWKWYNALPGGTVFTVKDIIVGTGLTQYEFNDLKEEQPYIGNLMKRIRKGRTYTKPIDVNTGIL